MKLNTHLHNTYWHRTRGNNQKSDLEYQGQIWYSLGFEELGLGFGGETLENNSDYRVSKGDKD